MKAELWVEERVGLGEKLWAELVIWRVPVPVRGSTHSFKYRLALIDDDVCVLRYDNEAGKGDHKHLGDKELPYFFSSIKSLRRDFMEDVKEYRQGGGR